MHCVLSLFCDGRVVEIFILRLVHLECGIFMMVSFFLFRLGLLNHCRNGLFSFFLVNYKSSLGECMWMWSCHEQACWYCWVWRGELLPRGIHRYPMGQWTRDWYKTSFQIFWWWEMFWRLHWLWWIGKCWPFLISNCQSFPWRRPHRWFWILFPCRFRRIWWVVA